VTLFTVCSDWLAGRRARAFAYYVRQFVKLFVQLSHSVNKVLGSEFPWQLARQTQGRQLAVHGVRSTSLLWLRLDAFDQWCLRRGNKPVPYTAHITNEEVRRRNYSLQSSQLSQRDDFVCSDILREPIHHKTTHTFFKQPSIVVQGIGDDGQVDQGGHNLLLLEALLLFITHKKQHKKTYIIQILYASKTNKKEKCLYDACF